MPNYDEKTGIRYGVISPHSISSFALDDIYNNGTDPHYENFKTEIMVSVRDMAGQFPIAIDEDTIEEISDLLIDKLGENWESCGDGQMDYSDKEYDLHVSGDNFGIFVMRSPYYTYCRGCSPCAPGAGDLNVPVDPSEENEITGNYWLSSNGKTLCLGPEWFDQEKTEYSRNLPYRVFRVDNDEEVI